MNTEPGLRGNAGYVTARTSFLQKENNLWDKYSKFVDKPKYIKLMHKLAEVCDRCQKGNVDSCQPFVYYLADDRVGRNKPNFTSQFVQQLKNS